eukprot:TRINITY_DN190_c0_g2_i1.p1 TRINITY_DN190_c0_g2~~TRINITY_DN190_c0_g2_i1.p1  ORF type:complete len:940 (-),score=153.29 TRINITY_DN190_c0_g2_i1:120-2939(-)
MYHEGPVASHFEESTTTNYMFPEMKEVWSPASKVVTSAPADEAEPSSTKNPLLSSLDNTALRIASIELSTSGTGKKLRRTVPEPSTQQQLVVGNNNILELQNSNNKKRGRDEVDLLRNLDPEKLKEALVDCLSRQTTSIQHPKLKDFESTTAPYLSEVIEQYDSLNHSMFYNSSPLKRQPYEVPQMLRSLETSVSQMYANAAALTVRDYNQEFQELKEGINKIMRSRETKHSVNYCFANPDPQMRLLLEKCEKLMEDFFYAAKTYSRIIVSEFNLPDEQKTIKPAHSGKYFHKGIMFRFAMDKLTTDCLGRKQWVFGGDTRNDILAIKAAAKEFSALSMFISVDCLFLCYPIMAMIDYKGYRVTVTPVLPIDKTTIVYGSNDGGKTVHADIPEVNKVVEEIGTRLRLKEHKVGKDPQTSKMLYTPGNFQVHKGKDNRYYAVGFGRIFPPEAPCADPNIACTLAEKRSVLYKFLRPEFHVALNEKLSPDAFSDWSKLDENRQENDDQVRAATVHLFNQVIPAFAAEVEREVDIDFSLPYDALTEHIITRIRLVTRARFAGLNMRNLGRVRSYLQSESNRKFLLSICVSRVVKRKIRDEMRRVLNKMKGTPSDLPFREAVVRVINTLLGHTPQSQNFWQNELRNKLQEMFQYVLNDQEKQSDYDLKPHTDIRTILIGILTSTGILIKPAALVEMMVGTYNFELLTSDLMEIVPRIRITGKFYIIRSKLMRLSALESTNQDSVARLLNTANSVCTIASFGAPKCPAICFEFSSLLLLILKKQIEKYTHLTEGLTFKEICSNDRIIDLGVDIEANFDTAFGRTEDSIACIASSFNLLQWSEIADLYAEWKARFGQESLVEAYREQRDRISKMAALMVGPTGSHSEALSIIHCAEAKALVIFRETTRRMHDTCSQHKCGRRALLRCTFRFGSFQDLICMGWRYG